MQQQNQWRKWAVFALLLPISSVAPAMAGGKKISVKPVTASANIEETAPVADGEPPSTMQPVALPIPLIIATPKSTSEPISTRTPEIVAIPTPSPVQQTAEKPSKVSRKAVANISGVEQWRELVAQYPWPVDQALSVMQCESGGNPASVSPTNDHGLFQLHDGLVSYGEKVYDPATNVGLAYNNYYKSRGWQPWSCARILGIL